MYNILSFLSFLVPTPCFSSKKRKQRQYVFLTKVIKSKKFDSFSVLFIANFNLLYMLFEVFVVIFNSSLNLLTSNQDQY